MKNHTDDDELLPPTPDQTQYLRTSQDPYAKLSVTLKAPEHAVAVPSAQTQVAQKKGATQKEFETTFRKIIGFYVPDSNRLPGTYREFLERNKKRSPSVRQRLIDKLRKYDLSDVRVDTHFNRDERDRLTEARLKDIEESVTDE